MYLPSTEHLLTTFQIAVAAKIARAPPSSASPSIPHTLYRISGISTRPIFISMLRIKPDHMRKYTTFAVRETSF